MFKSIDEIVADQSLVSRKNLMLTFHSVIYEVDKSKYQPHLETISLEKVIGTFKGEYPILPLGMLATQYFQQNTVPYHNQIELEKLLNANNIIAYPMVSEYKGFYYISGDGNHRLISGKLLSIKNAKALVFHLNKDDGDQVVDLIKNKKF